jgi:nickel transport protein
MTAAIPECSSAPITARRTPASVWSLLVAALVLLLGSAPVVAHKLKVFATAEGKSISGRAYFAGGAPAKGARVLITSATGELLAELQPDADGRFTYLASAPLEHRVSAETADGHRAEWRIPAEVLAGGFGLASPPPAPAVRDNTSTPPQPPMAEPAPAAGAPPATPGPPLTRVELETALARQLRPLREELLATREALRLQDILGGIGTIFGLTGLALWWRCRRRPPADQGSDT